MRKTHQFFQMRMIEFSGAFSAPYVVRERHHERIAIQSAGGPD
jgi:hypothetical protein